MNKAVATIGAMGLAGCFLLALAMQQLADSKEARRSETPAEVLKRRFASRLTGDVRIHEEHDGRGLRLVANVQTPAGTENPTIGEEIGTELRRMFATAAEPPFEVVVEVRAEGSTWVRRAVVPRPMPPR